MIVIKDKYTGEMSVVHHIERTVEYAVCKSNDNLITLGKRSTQQMLITMDLLKEIVDPRLYDIVELDGEKSIVKQVIDYVQEQFDNHKYDLFFDAGPDIVKRSILLHSCFDKYKQLFDYDKIDSLSSVISVCPSTMKLEEVAKCRIENCIYFPTKEDAFKIVTFVVKTIEEWNKKENNKQNL